MGKAKNPRKNAAASAASPYSRPTGKGSAAKNNVFKFNTNVGQVRSPSLQAEDMRKMDAGEPINRLGANGLRSIF